jgi:hypothetical protein
VVDAGHAFLETEADMHRNEMFIRNNMECETVLGLQFLYLSCISKEIKCSLTL